MNLNDLEKIFSGKPTFQLRQAKEAIFKHLVENWNEATNLPLEMRKKLNQECPLQIDGKIFISKDKNTAKASISLSDSDKIETVLMRHEGGRNTVCVSSQVGCPMACLFCATGETGFKRNLEPMEIVAQVLFFARQLKKTNQRVDNIVFMGMGEPFLNYDNVIEAIKIFNNQQWGLSIGSRHISISTVGIIEGIEKLTQEPLQLNLAISLHTASNNLRSKLIPANNKYPIEKIIKATDKYLEKTGRKVMFEYIMIKDFNDSEQQAEGLISLLKKMTSRLWFVNLIPCNKNACLEPSSPKQISRFKDILQSAGINATQRFSFGDDIQGACGQLAAKN